MHEEPFKGHCEKEGFENPPKNKQVHDTVTVFLFFQFKITVI